MNPPLNPTGSGDDAPLEQRLFEQALSLPATERPAYLDRAAAGDAEMIERILGLLQAHEAGGDFMALPVLAREGSGVGGVADRSEPKVGDRIDRYLLLERIGEGGFGVVFLAQQEEPLRRRVALKLIKLGMDTREVIARFETERQALARMDHPGIARVYDGGTTAAGRPYFVMEWVRGTPITTYCDQQNLDVRRRLELFLETCRAVQHAHQKGVIHRDLKPSNILVAEQDSRPVPKVIDFGIAKATEPGLSNPAAFTQAHAFIGTPAYMSPEQTRLSGVDVDTRSDIYSLGVLLYELLTGHTPFDRATLLSAGYSEVERIIREVEPPWPSQRVSRIGSAERAEVAQRRGLEPPRLKRRLRGDLDRVVMKCLEKDRGRRYETVNALALDVQRHLRHEPVRARPDTLRYRAMKFVRRHRAPVAVSLALLLALLGGLAGTLTQARRALRASGIAAAEAASSRAVVDFLRHDLLAQANPDQERDRELKLRTALDRAAERIGQRFAEQPLVEAAVRETLASTYQALGEFVTARQHWERARDLRRRERGGEHPETLQTEANLVDVLRLIGAYPEAEKLAHDVLARQRQVLGNEHTNTISSLNNLGLIYSRQARHREAQACYAEALALRQRVSGPEHPDTLAALHNLAGAYLELNQRDEGERLSLEAVALARRILGLDHPNTLTAINNLAHMYLDFGNLPEAERYCTEALASRRRVLGDQHPLTLISSTTLARIYSSQGKLAQAEALNREILAAQQAKLGPEHPDTLITMNNLGTVCRDLGRIAEAARWHAETLDKLQRVLGPEHPFALNSRGKVIGIYCDQARWDEAAEFGVETLTLCARVVGPSHPYTGQAQRFTGLARLRQQRWEEAEALLRPALAAATARKRPWPSASIQGHLGEALRQLGRDEEAEALLLEAHQGFSLHLEAIPGPDRAQAAEIARQLAELYRARGRAEEAAKWDRAAASADTAPVNQA